MTSPSREGGKGQLQNGDADAYLARPIVSPPTVDLLKLVIVESLIAGSVSAGLCLRIHGRSPRPF